MKRILLISDDPPTLLALHDCLRRVPYDVILAKNCARGCAQARRGKVDLIVLDPPHSGEEGAEACRRLRREAEETPILMLFERAGDAEILLALEIGADDYASKPVNVRDVLARVRALFRRIERRNRRQGTYVFGDVRVDLSTQVALKEGRPLKLTAREFRLLRYFIDHEREVVSREMLLNDVWGYDVYPTTRTVDNYILSLRKKVERDPSRPEHFITVHTAGYRFVPRRGGR